MYRQYNTMPMNVGQTPSPSGQVHRRTGAPGRCPRAGALGQYPRTNVPSANLFDVRLTETTFQSVSELSEVL